MSDLDTIIDAIRGVESGFDRDEARAILARALAGQQAAPTDEKVYKAISDRYATSLSPSAEKRLDDLQRGLLRLCRQSEDPDYPTRGGWRGWLRAKDIHDLLKESL